jgi:hypothetical protein
VMRMLTECLIFRMGVTPRRNRGRLLNPEADGEDLGSVFGMGRRRMRKAEDLDSNGYPDLPEGFTRPCDTDGDGVPDLPDGVTPRWNRGHVSDPEDIAECPFRGRGRRGAAAAETP